VLEKANECDENDKSDLEDTTALGRGGNGFVAPSYRACCGPGITGPVSIYRASGLHQHRWSVIYSWGTVSRAPERLCPGAISGTCSTMQVPGPTLIVTEGQTVQ